MEYKKKYLLLRVGRSKHQIIKQMFRMISKLIMKWWGWKYQIDLKEWPEKYIVPDCMQEELKYICSEQ